jgi:hypothetical protein
MPIKYHIHLSTEERQELNSLIRSGKSSVRTQTRARILLLCDESKNKKKTTKKTDNARIKLKRLYPIAIIDKST